VQDLLPALRRRHVTYGLSPQADYSARGLRSERLETRFIAYRQAEPLGEFRVRMPGQHNVQNCLAALAVADELEVPLDVVQDALSGFGGVARRFTVVAEVGGVTLVDDYGHHPAEIIATLAAARAAFDGRVLVAFQPHRFSRTEQLFDEFTRAFNGCDRLVVTDVYAAGEAPIEGITAERLALAIAEHGHHGVSYVGDRAEIARILAAEARPGDVVLALGAGDINRILGDVKIGLGARLAAKGSSP
jgi:UDP-N-acetylmuramate--alanine ligase